jgi:hypothetical protein
MLQGNATIYFENGNKFEGIFVEGYINGRGKLYVNDRKETIIEGIFSEVKKEVEIDFEDGCRYIGEWDTDKMEGAGQFFYCRYKDRFEGIFHNNYFLSGKIIYEEGHIYEGTYEKNVKHGKGMITYKNGDKYIGDFSHNRVEGKGKYIYANGDTFEGEFRNDKKSGYGESKLLTKQETYKGYYENDKKNGQGEYFCSNGDHIIGIFEDDYIKNGKINYKNGETYEGEFSCSEQNYRNGKGKHWYKNGGYFEGDWEKI